MSEVVDINSRKPVLEGTAKCVACKHEWQAEAPAGTKDLECPSCGLMRGAWKYHLFGPSDGYRWICTKCDSDIFYVITTGCKCLGCGEHFRWSQLH